MPNMVRTVYDVLDYEIAHGTQRSVGVLYGLAMISLAEDRKTCRRINEAVMARWSMNGLERVKKIAWELHGAMTSETAAP